MLEVIEAKPPLPRWFPPHEHGLFAAAPQEGWEAGPHGPGTRTDESNPTLVNNVETLANVAQIVVRGADWFRSTGTADSPGTVVATVVGDVVSPGVGEVELGTPLRQVIDTVGGGLGAGRSVKAVLSGVANPVVTAHDLDTPLSHEGFASIGSGMGAAGLAVYDDTACMVAVARHASHFLYIESCGQCPPCKRGSREITEHLDRIEAGAGDDGDIAGLEAWLERVTDGNRCYLAVEEQRVVSSLLRAFPEEFAAHIEAHGCPRPGSGDRPIPKLVDLTATGARYDEQYHRKRPDWTYAPEDGARG